MVLGSLSSSQFLEIGLWYLGKRTNLSEMFNVATVLVEVLLGTVIEHTRSTGAMIFTKISFKVP